MALLIIGGMGYALLIMFMLGAMMLSGRAADREARRLQPVAVRTSTPVACSNTQQPASFSPMAGRDAA
ncbi:hypothetical protein GCM10010082_11740 [Kushneria pakistanensis]|uniref:Uncharacterized protein n=1 Tax=Kushneria pakistanensis TaxID=1508770 RepID=A0ABQ3FFE1_9GAMM|nr:hypothetical protein [Kushneria pakistanensis]GHC21641.1 hypothetical protein GCM10010082_11740 [Kushneria pakistanensis]